MWPESSLPADQRAGRPFVPSPFRFRDDVPVSTEGALSMSETARGHCPPRFRMGVALEVIRGVSL